MKFLLCPLLAASMLFASDIEDTLIFRSSPLFGPETNYEMGINDSEPELVTTRSAVYGLDIDPLAGKVYWYEDRTFCRISLNEPDNIEVVLALPDIPVSGMALDYLNQRMYWQTSSTVESAKLNGEDHQTHLEIETSWSPIKRLTFNPIDQMVYFIIEGDLSTHMRIRRVRPSGEVKHFDFVEGWLESFTFLGDQGLASNSHATGFWRMDSNKPYSATYADLNVTSGQRWYHAADARSSMIYGVHGSYPLGPGYVMRYDLEIGVVTPLFEMDDLFLIKLAAAVELFQASWVHWPLYEDGGDPDSVEIDMLDLIELQNRANTPRKPWFFGPPHDHCCDMRWAKPLVERPFFILPVLIAREL